MTQRQKLTYEQAADRIDDDPPPAFWVGDGDTARRRLERLKRGAVSQLTESPGGRPIHLVEYGDRESFKPQANFNSAIGAREPERYVDRSARDTPVVLLIGPVHGAEFEGLTGLMNLIEVLETGTDRRGQSHPELHSLAERCRLLIIPNGNPDGMARVEVESLVGKEQLDLRFWGQGTWADDTVMGWPETKRQHPMTDESVGFLGGYYNDAGINPMHDEFFDPMGPEAPAILDLARREAPDVATTLHSYQPPPGILRPAYTPMAIQESVRAIQSRYNDHLDSARLPTHECFEPSAELGSPPPHFTLVGALYHVCGAQAFVHECPHGLAEDDACTVTHEEILDIQLALYRAIFEHVLDDTHP